MRTYKIGIIGYGGFGKFLHHWWKSLDRVAIVAVSDESLNDGHIDGLRTYGDWRSLLKNPEIDIVSIATPPFLHSEIACEAMRAGKMYCLKNRSRSTLKAPKPYLKCKSKPAKSLWWIICFATTLL